MTSLRGNKQMWGPSGKRRTPPGTRASIDEDTRACLTNCEKLNTATQGVAIAATAIERRPMSTNESAADGEESRTSTSASTLAMATALAGIVLLMLFSLALILAGNSALAATSATAAAGLAVWVVRRIICAATPDRGTGRDQEPTTAAKAD